MIVAEYGQRGQINATFGAGFRVGDFCYSGHEKCDRI
jgi:hypothetical protein